MGAMAEPTQTQLTLREYIRKVRLALDIVFWHIDEIIPEIFTKEGRYNISKYLMNSDITSTRTDIQDEKNNLFDDVLYVKTNVKEKRDLLWSLYNKLNDLYKLIEVYYLVKIHGAEFDVLGHYYKEDEREEPTRLRYIEKEIKALYMTIQMKYLKDLDNHPLVTYMTQIYDNMQEDS